MKKSIAYGATDTTVVKEQIASNQKLLDEWVVAAKK